jgi:hypothetical protein
VLTLHVLNSEGHAVRQLKQPCFISQTGIYLQQGRKIRDKSRKTLSQNRYIPVSQG